jgi:hypothetical protein
VPRTLCEDLVGCDVPTRVCWEDLGAWPAKKERRSAPTAGLDAAFLGGAMLAGVAVTAVYAGPKGEWTRREETRRVWEMTRRMVDGSAYYVYIMAMYKARTGSMV